MPKQRRATAKQTQKSPPTAKLARLKRITLKPFDRLRAMRVVRAHKSFKLTRRRDIPKRAPLPGYFAFTALVIRKLVAFKKPFLVLLVLYVIAALLLIGVSQQDQYRSLVDAIGDVSKEAGTDGLDTVTQVGGMFGATILGTLNSSLTDTQQFYLGVAYALMWLIVVWLLRQLLAGNVVKVRDGLYSAGAPLVSSVCILMLMMIQALPGALGLLIFSTATQNGILSGGVAAMCFGVLALLLILLSLYWLTSSFFALIIVTLPGTYPMTAVRGASEIALGRRVQLLVRLLWMMILILVLWAIILVPALFIDLWVKVSWLPLVTIAVQVATGTSFIVGATYIYLMYRGMIDEPAK